MSFRVGDKVTLRNCIDYVYIIDEININNNVVYFTRSRFGTGRGHDYCKNIKKVAKPGEQLTFDW